LGRTAARTFCIRLIGLFWSFASLDLRGVCFDTVAFFLRGDQDVPYSYRQDDGQGHFLPLAVIPKFDGDKCTQGFFLCGSKSNAG
jgi:hypothetical protein